MDVWESVFVFLDCYFRCVDREGLRLGLMGAAAYCNKVCYDEAKKILSRR